MILTCPSCGTQYVVKDGAIPPGGRQVRCASCKHSWHQDPEELDLTAPLEPEPELAATGASEADKDESIAEATLIEPRSGPEAEERAYEETLVEDETDTRESESTAIAAEPAPPISSGDWNAPPQAEAEDDDFSPFAAADVARPRSRSPILVILVVALLIAALAAAFWFLAPPEWKARVGLPGSGNSPLALVTTHMDRQQLESGNELLTVTGRVINPTSSEQDVPPLQAQLRSRTGKIVYNWTIAPPARTLPAGGSASFNSAEVSVPPGGDELTITLGSPRA
jgi:predicted Zn finger-like uncharacterized protein